MPAPGTIGPMRLALFASVVWLVLVLAYALGFFGVIGVEAPDRPVMLGEVALLVLAALVPPALLVMVARMWQRTEALTEEARRLADAANLIGAQARVAEELNTSNLASALTEAARMATARDLEALQAMMARHDELMARISEDLQATRESGTATLAAAQEVRAGLTGLEQHLKTSLQDRATVREALVQIAANTGQGGATRAAAAGAPEELAEALGRMESLAAQAATDRDVLIAAAEATSEMRDEIRAALRRAGPPAAEGENGAASIPAVPELTSALARLEEIAEGVRSERAALVAETRAAASERQEIRAALKRLEARSVDPDTISEERRAAAAERDEIRAALARMEERAAAAEEARELLKAEQEISQRERGEIREALSRMEEKAAAVAADSRRLRAERVAAAAERDELRAALARLEERAIGTVEEERAALSEMLARIAEQQANSERALTALLERREAGEDLARLRRIQAARRQKSDADQPSLPLPALSDEPVEGEIDAALILRALHFPRDEADREGFRALRVARRDHVLADCLQAAEDVLTLLSQDGIYMDDLTPEDVPPELWVAFANGERGAPVRALGAIEDEAALAITRGRVRTDPVFRDATLHFLRRFDPVLRRLVEIARDVEIHALSATRTGRAFMLLARVHGAFD